MSQKRRAKIVGTIGPSSSSKKVLGSLIKAGLNVARVNMSHGNYDDHQKVISNIRETSKSVGQEVGILLDLQGPKIRVAKLSKDIVLKKDELWSIGYYKNENNPKKFIPTTYENLVSDSDVDCRILFDDGLIQGKTVEKDGNFLKIRITVGGTLKSNKGINLPDIAVSAPSLTKKDKKDLMFGLEKGVDFVALSFVREADDIREVKKLLHKLKINIPIIAKIERPEAIKNIEEIVKITDIIMVARGDMGVEIGNHLVPSTQKKIINLCNAFGTPVITATQMLESMIENPTPTRAEASDVANAIWDGTDAVMLSGETATGNYPVKAVEMMDKIVLNAEKSPKERPLIRNIDLSGVTAALQVSASLVAEKTFAKWIFTITESGKSCRQMAQFRPQRRVLGITNSLSVVRRMCLYWGITPYYYDGDLNDFDTLEDSVIEDIKKSESIHNGDKIVISRGDGSIFNRSRSNSLRVEIIKDSPKIMGGADCMDEVSFKKGKIILDTSLCASCHRCVAVCPHDIWAVSQDDTRNTYIKAQNAKHCTMDMQCVDACPTGAIEIQSKSS